MVTAAVGPVLSAAIVVTARLRAVSAFRRLASVLLTSNNAFIRFGRSALVASGVLEVLRRSIGLLVNPVTGLLTLLETGLATRRWLLFERSIRSARVQLSLMGLTTESINRGLTEMTTQLGRMASREIFQAGLALRNLFDPRLGEDLRLSILGIVESFSAIESVDPALLNQALAGLKLGGEEALEALAILQQMFPGLIQDGMSLTDIFDAVRDAGEGIASDQTISNIERMGEKIDAIRDRIDPILGQLGDLAALIPLVFVTVAGAAIFFILDRLREFKDAILGIGIVLGTVALFIIEAFGFTLAGEFEKLGPLWKKTWDEISRRTPEIINQLVSLFTAGLSGVVGRLTGLLNDWIDNTMLPKFGNFFGNILPEMAKGFFSAVTGLGTILSDFAKLVWDIFWNTILPDTVKAFVIGLGETIGEFFTITLPNLVKIGANLVIDQVNRIITLINKIPSLPFGLGGIPNIPGIPGFAHGGIVPGPTGQPRLAVVHGGERIMPVGGSASDVMEITIFIGDEKLDRILVQGMTRMAKQAGVSPRSTRHL